MSIPVKPPIHVTHPTPETFPTWEAWLAEHPDTADHDAWLEWRRDVCGTPIPAVAGPRTRQTIYKVQWKRGTSSARSRIFTKGATARAFVAQVREPDDKRGRGVRPLELVRLFTGSVVWDTIEED
jgi:hypothetical protein